MAENRPGGDGGFRPSLSANIENRRPVPGPRQTQAERQTQGQRQGNPPLGQEGMGGQKFPSVSPMQERRSAATSGRTKIGGIVPMAILVPVLLLAFALGISAAFYGIRSLGDQTLEQATVSPEAARSVVVDGSEQPGLEESIPDPSVATEPVAPAAQLTVPPPDPTKMVLELSDFNFFISGVVAEQAMADAIEEATATTYGKFGQSNIEVDPTLTPQPWIESAPDMIVGLWTLLDGRIEISADDTFVTGRSLNQDFVDGLLPYIGVEQGFPPLDNEIEVVDGRAAEFEAERVGDLVTLTGQLPSATIRDEIVAGTMEAFGEENVVDQLEIDPEVLARFGLILFHNDIAAYKDLGDFRTGLRDGQAYGNFDSGLNFDVSSRELSPESGDNLRGFPPIFARSKLPITITGHTDDKGSSEENLVLSAARAQSVGDYFVEQGLDPDRLVIVAKGEAEPVASNETEEGRALNRRVVFNQG